MDRNDYLILTGQTESHLVSYDEQFLIHKDILKPFKNLQEIIFEKRKCKLEILSGFRSFDRQKFIWNQKCNGKRAVRDNNGNPLDIEKLSPYELVCSIMRWSALPGFSRHHWGTDIDVFDDHNKPEHIELVPSEYQQGGPFYQLSDCLSELISADRCYEFYRPYETDLGGVAIEPWHLSFKPIAKEYQEMITLEVFEKFIAEKEFNSIELIESVRENAEEIYYRFISP
jgi:LAS superfamily LD-carboxypeptidase LdcB